MNSKSNKQYSIAPAKIGSQDGFRLPRAFSHDHPDLVSASGYVEVLDDKTLLVRLEPTNRGDENEEDGLMMSLFLDFLMQTSIENPDSLVPYTEEMSKEANQLIEGVELDED